ncbi:uncharacterized protein EHS24_005401 [Apiotrichum porosum]|uniref:Uncharacterized protein n=1 Tax=Apiotrichum porosum TaxID=105984 RepID=A0A427XD61_9TREE|nr:uncharacterized protein EHS24_005401 [Apiotrichum porosum]RSH76654.1 hypothetical protein EHS24_005401 [Apiotrichum porosum]
MTRKEKGTPKSTTKKAKSKSSNASSAAAKRTSNPPPKPLFSSRPLPKKQIKPKVKQQQVCPGDENGDNKGLLCNVTYTTEEDGTIAPYKELGRSLCFYCERLFTA